ncbi:hypothetical protein Tsubulata_046876 [Turnera subulata]|uniref:Uncharacterized protein n=1 Tax=Turnera subulata TaxID=218843 RepID=A0A9Q0G0V9_9ROSI|nr:hypothetical protein Tsubulata_051290 [Turnera subulata]KAJ4839901.1 hypothetical protein Tsubulata_046876 [Turnera subulata]
MISAKKLIKMARKWQKLAAIRRKRITFAQVIGTEDMKSCSTSSPTVEKGHFAVYSADNKRFLLPLECLSNEIVVQLLKLAEEEFGLSSGQPLRLPCDAELMEYIIALIKRNVTRDVKEAVLMSIASSTCSISSDLHEEVTNIQVPIFGF